MIYWGFVIGQSHLCHELTIPPAQLPMSRISCTEPEIDFSCLAFRVHSLGIQWRCFSKLPRDSNSMTKAVCLSCSLISTWPIHYTAITLKSTRGLHLFQWENIAWRVNCERGIIKSFGKMSASILMWLKALTTVHLSTGKTRIYCQGLPSVFWKFLWYNSLCTLTLVWLMIVWFTIILIFAHFTVVAYLSLQMGCYGDFPRIILIQNCLTPFIVILLSISLSSIEFKKLKPSLFYQQFPSLFKVYQDSLITEYIDIDISFVSQNKGIYLWWLSKQQVCMFAANYNHYKELQVSFPGIDDR